MIANFGPIWRRDLSTGDRGYLDKFLTNLSLIDFKFWILVGLLFLVIVVKCLLGFFFNLNVFGSLKYFSFGMV